MNFQNKEVFNQFLSYQDVSEITLKVYRVCLNKFCDYLQIKEIDKPTRQDILDYKSSLSDNHNLSSGTKRQYLRIVKQFFEWADVQGLYSNISRGIKCAKVISNNTFRDSFRAEDIQNILKKISLNTEIGLRDYCIILLCVTCGLRIIEIQRADIKDLETFRGQCRLYIQGKGHDSKDDYKKIIPEVEQALKKYLRKRGRRIPTNKNQPLFIGIGVPQLNNSCGTNRLAEPSISRIIKNRFKDAGYNTHRLTAHSLRHTSNTLLFESGADLFKVQQHARHTDPKITEIYIHHNEQEESNNERDIYDMIFNVTSNENSV